MKKLLAIFVLSLWSFTSQASIIGLLTDHHRTPVHIFAKKTDNNDVIITVVSKYEFTECVFSPGHVFGRDFISESEDGKKLISISLYNYDEKTGKPYDGQAENQAFFDKETGYCIHELSVRAEFYCNSSKFKEDELGALATNDNIIGLQIQSFAPHEYDTKAERRYIKLNELENKYGLVYESHFEKAPSLEAMDSATQIK